MKWTQYCLSAALGLSLSATPLVAQAQVFEIGIDHIQLDSSVTELAQLDRRSGETLQDLKRDPSKAALLSALYPGLGHFYIGNDNNRALWVTGAGTLIIAGSIVGYGLLADRPEEASGLGNLMITLTLVGYYLWNVRDAYVQAVDYNTLLESENRLSWLEHLDLSMQQNTLFLTWKTAL